MPLSQESLKQRIIEALEERSFKQGEHSRLTILADAIAQAVVDEIQANAKVIVSGGSSSGTYDVV